MGKRIILGRGNESSWGEEMNHPGTIKRIE